MRIALLLLTLLLSRAQPALAACSTFPVTSADQICAPGANPCVVTQAYCVASAATLDFGTRRLEFERRGQFEVAPGGTVTIRAGGVNLMAVGGACAIAGASADVTIQATGDVTIGRNGNTFACIDASGDPGGSVDIAAQGSVNIQGVLDTHSTGDSPFGNSITIEGLQVTIDPKAEIDISGNTVNDAGDLTVFGRARTLMGGLVKGKGTEGGQLEIYADDGDVDTTNATLELQGSQGAGFGGSLIIDAGRTAILGGRLFLSGDAGGDDVGDAGSIDVTAGLDIAITAAALDLNGAPNGDAGTAVFDADRDITQTAKITAKARGEGVGGRVEYQARRALILDEVDVSGESPNGSGGAVDAVAWCSLVFPGPSSRTIRAVGPGGTITLASGGPLTVAGSLEAGAGNTIEYRGVVPIISGNVVPPTSPIQNTGLVPCGGPPICGNGALEVDETCDGSAPSDDTCGTQICKPDCSGCTPCGNGRLDTGETCDASALPDDGCGDGSACTPTCDACQQCGNGTKDPGEVCDGATGCPAGQTCAADCQAGCAVRCGDGVKDGSEACDDGNAIGCDGCSAACTIEECGNGIRECSEFCDDGNKEPCTGACGARCDRFSGVCGDGITECGEGRDDGNAVSCDGASANCEIEQCGNSVPECSEQCDDGPAGSSTCSAQCQAVAPPSCGDGVLQLFEGEACDDGNNTDCDGCAANCLRADDVCGDRIVDAACGEQCDDGGQIAGDGCTTACRREECGNGIRDIGELCDAGARNGQAGSGCSTSCRPLGICTTASVEECIPCADYLDCSPLGACGGSICSAGVCTPVPQPDCDDGNPCTTDACAPATGCTSTARAAGPAAGCDDGDACTDDVCSASACVSSLRPGVEGAQCRLTRLQQAIDGSTDIPKGPRKTLRNRARTIGKKLPMAAGTGKKADRGRKAIGTQLKAMTRLVSKLEPKLSPPTSGSLNAGIAGVSAAIATF